MVPLFLVSYALFFEIFIGREKAFANLTYYKNKCHYKEPHTERKPGKIMIYLINHSQEERTFHFENLTPWSLAYDFWSEFVSKILKSPSKDKPIKYIHKRNFNNEKISYSKPFSWVSLSGDIFSWNLHSR